MVADASRWHVVRGRITMREAGERATSRPRHRPWASKLFRLRNGEVLWARGRLWYDVSISLALRMAAWSKAVAKGFEATEFPSAACARLGGADSDRAGRSPFDPQAGPERDESPAPASSPPNSLRDKARFRRPPRLASNPKCRTLTKPRAKLAAESAERTPPPAAHGGRLVATSVVPPAEAHAVVFQRDQTLIGDGDAVGIARQVFQHLPRSAEGWFGIDDPFGPGNPAELFDEVAPLPQGGHETRAFHRGKQFSGMPRRGG
jgi:hypothetical protein